MAGREGQGLQIAVIIFAMLTIILAITTFVFYSQAQTAEKERQTAVTNQGTAEDLNKKLLYRILALKHTLGMAEMTEVDEAKSRVTGQKDDEVDGILANFATDMATYSAEAGAPGAANYRTLPAYLLGAIARKNVSVADANDQTKQIQVAKDTDFTAQKNRADAAEAARDTARDDLGKEKTAFDTAKAAIDAEKNKIAAQITTDKAKAKAEFDKVAKERDAYVAQASDLQNTITIQKDRLETLEKSQVDLFENPDGKITWVNQKQQLVWLNLGRADGLMRQTNFSVYDHDENGVSNAEPKARLEVIRIVGDHLAEARILEDLPSNPILPGDIVHTPSWSSGQRIHFALAGMMDINKDGVSDFDLVKNIILLNGGVIDAELREDGTRGPGTITVNTRYLVLGELPNEKSTQKAVDEFSKIRTEADNAGTAKIDVQRLLEMMGWKAEERTVELAGSSGTGEFRKRSPGKKAPATPATTPAPAAGPATETPSPAPADPFGGPAADPFGGPAPAPARPMPMPAAEPDPFGTP
jgi:hypothetical protein